MKNWNSQNCTHMLYSSVLDDVMHTLEATFVDEGVDDDVRLEMKELWKKNWEEMGAVTDYHELEWEQWWKPTRPPKVSRREEAEIPQGDGGIDDGDDELDAAGNKKQDTDEEEKKKKKTRRYRRRRGGGDAGSEISIFSHASSVKIENAEDIDFSKVKPKLMLVGAGPAEPLKKRRKTEPRLRHQQLDKMKVASSSSCAIYGRCDKVTRKDGKAMLELRYGFMILNGKDYVFRIAKVFLTNERPANNDLSVAIMVI